MSGRGSVIVAVLRDPVLRSVQGAFVAFSISEWATWLAIVVYAYDRGGATEAGIVAFVQLIPSVIVAPVAASFGDRYPRGVVLLGSYMIQAAAMALTAVVLALGAAPLLVYVLATVTATSITLTRPAHAALLPEVVTDPAELSAANATSGLAESAGAMVGPVVTGILVAAGGPGLVFAGTAAAMAVASVSVLPSARAAARAWSEATAAARAPASAVNPAPAEPTTDAALAGDAAEDDIVAVPASFGDGAGETPQRDGILAGVALVASDARLRSVVLVMAASMVLLGALDVIYAVLAVDVLDLGDAGVGFLGAATGVGSVAGSGLALAFLGRGRLGLPLTIGALVFGTAVAAVGIVPQPLVAPFLLLVAGSGASVAYVAAQTLTQRIARPEVLSRVFGVLEGLTMLSQAVGAIVVPLLVAVAGPAGAPVIAGLALTGVALLASRTLAAVDRSAIVRTTELAILRGDPIFAPLPPQVLEALAARLVPVRRADGATIIRQGEPGDRFYLIESGSVEVEVDGSVRSRQGAGESFGEIALLRNVPRTATVRAVGAVRLYALERELFLEAITGQPRSRALAAQVAERRLLARDDAASPP